MSPTASCHKDVDAYVLAVSEREMQLLFRTIFLILNTAQQRGGMSIFGYVGLVRRWVSIQMY